MRKTVTAFLTAVVLSSVATVSAHEFILCPKQFHVEDNQSITVSALSAHVLMKSEEIEPVENVEVSLVKGDQVTPISMAANNKMMTLNGKVELDEKGTSILCGHRKGMVWTKTTSGWKQAAKSEVEGAISSGKYEKFSKALVSKGQPDNGFKQIIGHDLEIVAEENPESIHVGQEISLRVLYKGKPLATQVFATYDGFSENTNTYAYVTQANSTGEAKVKITAPGTRMARVEHELDEATDAYDKHVIRAVLLFSVKG